MAGETQNNNQSADQGNASAVDNDTARETVAPLLSELGPNGLPIHPPQGEEPDKVDSSLILDAFFGEGKAEPKTQGADQAGEPKAPGGQSKKGSLAPPVAAPTANAGEDSSQEPGSSSGQQPGTKQEPSGGEGAAQTPGRESQSPPEPKPSPQLSAEDRLKLASVDALTEQNRALLDRLRQFESGKPPVQSQGQQPPSGKPAEQPSSSQPGAAQEPLRLVVPDPLFDTITSDDRETAKQGMSLLVTAVAQNAVNYVMQRIEPLVDQKLSSLTAALEDSKKVSQMEEQYFERYPQHRNELYRTLIQQVVNDKFAAFPHANWDETMMDAVGATVNEKLKSLGVDLSQKVETPTEQGNGANNGNGSGGQGQGRQKPAPMFDGSARSGKGVPENAGDFIASTFQ